MTLDVTTPEVYTSQGVPVIVDGVSQIKIKKDQASLHAAAGRFLGKKPVEIARIALETVRGHLRATLGTMSVEDIYKEPRSVRAEGPGGVGRRPRQHGARNRLVHHPRHQGQAIAQVPPVVESLTGLRVDDLVKGLQKDSNTTRSDSPAPPTA